MILLTGGSGFIGNHFLDLWLSTTTERVVNLDILNYAARENRVENAQYRFVHGDVCDQTLITRLLEEESPRAIVHMAAQTHVDRAIISPQDFWQNNVIGSCQLLEAVRQWWQELPGGKRRDFRLLMVSTDEVYGSLAADAPGWKEGAAYRPGNPYSASKAAADHFAKSYFLTYGLPVMITHAGNNYGPGQYPEKLIPVILNRAIRGEAIPVYGDGRQLREWLYVRDHCQALQLCLEQGRAGDHYHIASGEEIANRELVKRVCDFLDNLCPRADGQSYCEQITFVPDRPGHDLRYHLDTGKICRELGWQAKIPLQEGLRETVCQFVTGDRE